MELTREQILAEPAGCQLDDWTAEYVMGWKLYEEENPYGYSGQMNKVWRCQPNWLRVCEARNWLPSRKMVDAFCLVERIKDTCPASDAFTMEWDGESWIAGFRSSDYDRGWVWEESATTSISLPLAICHLALLLQLSK